MSKVYIIFHKYAEDLAEQVREVYLNEDQAYKKLEYYQLRQTPKKYPIGEIYFMREYDMSTNIEVEYE